MTIDTIALSGDSTLLSSPVEYDTQARILHVVFKKNGARYAYHNVPPEVVAALTLDHKPGQYFTAHIKGVYAYTKES